MKQTIFYIVSSLIKAGPENVLYDIISNLDFNKYDVIIYTLKKEEELRSNLDEFKKLNARIIQNNFSNYYLELFPNRIAKRIKDLHLDRKSCIIHAHCYHPVLIASYLTEYKTVATLHNISIEDFTMLRGRFIGKYMAYRFNRAIKSIDINVAISQYMLDYYKPFISKKIIRIPNGVNFIPKETVEYNKLCGIYKKNDKKIIIVSGRLSMRKNVHYIIDELSKSERHDFLCLFLGIGEELESCKKQAKNDERFVFLGYKENVQDYLMLSDLYISASYSEGLPLSVLEALNIGLPCLLSKIPPHIEICNNMALSTVKLFEIKEGYLKTLFESVLDEKYDKRKISDKAYLIYSAVTMSNAYQKIYNNSKL